MIGIDIENIDITGYDLEQIVKQNANGYMNSSLTPGVTEYDLAGYNFPKISLCGVPRRSIDPDGVQILKIVYLLLHAEWTEY